MNNKEVVLCQRKNFIVFSKTRKLPKVILGEGSEAALKKDSDTFFLHVILPGRQICYIPFHIFLRHKKTVSSKRRFQTVDKVAPEMRSGATFRVPVAFSLNYK